MGLSDLINSKIAWSSSLGTTSSNCPATSRRKEGWRRAFIGSNWVKSLGSSLENYWKYRSIICGQKFEQWSKSIAYWTVKPPWKRWWFCDLVAKPNILDPQDWQRNQQNWEYRRFYYYQWCLCGYFTCYVYSSISQVVRLRIWWGQEWARYISLEKWRTNRHI